MKEMMVICVVLMFSISFAYAGGGKNVGTKGKGTVSTGSTAQGASSQQRAGR